MIKSAARRHSFAGAGGDSDPFPVHAGDLTGIIADLLSLLPPSATQPSSAGESRSGPAAAAAAEASDIMDDGDGRKMSGHGVEPADVRALRLAALPTWPLLDAPNAFHEVFACAALVLEAAQVRGNRGHQHLRVSPAFGANQRGVGRMGWRLEELSRHVDERIVQRDTRRCIIISVRVEGFSS